MPTSDARSRPFLSAVILAAGASTRMGRPKQLLTLGSKCLLQHVVDAALKSVLNEVIVVLGHRAAEIEATLRFPEDASVRAIVNSAYSDGQSTSLRLGIQSIDPRSSAAAILLGDQPGVGAELIDAVAAHFVANDAPIARPSFAVSGEPRRPGHPVFLARRSWPQVDGLTGDLGARALIESHPEWLSELYIDTLLPPDLDTPEDYEQFKRLIG